MTLTELQQEAHRQAQQNGFIECSFCEAVALLHSEVSEALEAWRMKGLSPWESDGGKPEGVGPEFADILIRLADYAERFGIDLEAEVHRKMAYNKTRPYRHGGKLA